MSAGGAPPVLELDGARPAPDEVWADAAAEAELPAMDLRLGPGEGALVEAQDRRWGRALVDAARDVDVPLAPVHVATDEVLVPLAGDDLVAAGDGRGGERR